LKARRAPSQDPALFYHAARRGWARLGAAWLGEAWHGTAGRGSARQGKVAIDEHRGNEFV